MTGRVDFYPARPHSGFIRFAWSIIPFALRYCGVVKLSLPDADFARLQAIADRRCIIAPNHPSRVEPIIVADLSRRINRQFYFISARENFELRYGALLQRVGAYSIARGTPDRTSLAATRSLLAEQDRQVVLFPEGEVYHHNDIMLPLNSGVAQIGFWALADLVKLGKPLEMPILPVAVKYRFLENPETYTLSRVATLEKAVGIDKIAMVLKDRVMALGARIVASSKDSIDLGQTEQYQNGLTGSSDGFLCAVLGVLGIEKRDHDAPLPEQMRAMFNAVREFSIEGEHQKSEYEKKLQDQRAVEVKMVLSDLARIHDCIAISGHYVSDFPTYERLGDVLGRMEEEVFGRHARYPKREALVRIAEPVELSKMIDDYKANKRETTARATAEVAQRISDLLDSLADTGNPISTGDWPKE